VKLLLKKSVLVFLLLSTALSGLAIVSPVSADDSVKSWALIVDGDYLFAGDSAYMYHALHDHYDFAGICYLSDWPYGTIPGVNGSATKENMRWAIRTWLYNKSDSNDIIFVFFSNHGGGYNTKTGNLSGGRWDSSFDEGNEHYIGNQWKGVDECICFPRENQSYWDDELKEDLDYLASDDKYGKLIFVGFACYSGGFIDDLSAPNRIIMTDANETYTGKLGCGSPDRPFQNDWAARFTDALHGEEAYWDPNTRKIVRIGDLDPDPDWSNDGNVSMWEAWDYAWNKDHWRPEYETPWLDDNGNHKPNYIEGSEKLDSYDGLFSMETYFGSGNLKSADVDDSGKVDILDVSIVAKAYESYPGHPRWNPLADLNNDQIVDIIDMAYVSKHYGKWYPIGSGSKGEKAGSDLLEGTASLSIYPNEVKVHKNEVFSVDVNVAGVTDLYAYEFKIYYDKTVLSCVDVDLPKGHFLEPINDPDNICIVKMQYDNAYNATHGRILVAVTLLGDEPGKDGDGALVTITFNAEAKGKPIFTIQDIMLVKAKSLNPLKMP